MKRTIARMIFLLVLTAETSLAQTARERLAKIFDVRGMSSPMCELAIRGALGSTKGIDAVEVNRQQGVVKATFDEESISAASIAGIINSLGFRATLRGDETGSSMPAEAIDTPFCGDGDCVSKIVELSGKSEGDVQKVIDFSVRYISEKESIPTGEEIFNATGVGLTRESLPFLQQAVLARLLTDPNARKFLEGSRCNDYGACSLHRNLMNATGEELEMYFREKAEDGQRYDRRQLPHFGATDLDSRPVQTGDLEGRPVVLAFLAFHCIHSTESLPLLAKLQAEFDEIRFVAVLVNSTTAEEAEPLLKFHWPDFARQFEVWVYDDPNLGDLVESHLVPTYLLLDEQSRVLQKLVGFKKFEELDRALASLTQAQTQN